MAPVKARISGAYLATFSQQVRVARVWYGRPTVNGWEPWPEWDGYRFHTTRDKLTNKRVMPLFNART